MFQSTHPHRVRLKSKAKDDKSKKVSIHAPTQGATQTIPKEAKYRIVSIHAPTQGATPLLRRPRRLHTRFNPRTHTGCDIVKLVIRATIMVSIHAPTQGATQSISPMLRLPDVSIHAPTQGATHCREYE